MQKIFYISACVFTGLALVSLWITPYGWILVGLALLFDLLGVIDCMQTTHAIRRNFPVIGRFRYLFEAIRPEINQYFIESNTNGVPLSREQRSIVYARAKSALDTLPFGTQRDVYATGYEWVNHSLVPKTVDVSGLRLDVGSDSCERPYSASIFNISAMSYGALSKNAVLALNGGAKDGGFIHNTGEGGVSPYHLKPGGDVLWQIGTAYFGCRTEDGRFSAERFQETATKPSVKMIELKLSQGAKPGHGGMLPGEKVSSEISKIRGIPEGRDCLSPPAHSAFSTPRGLLEFLVRLRELSGGKPVGFKLCIGKRREFLAICKAMHQTKLYPDFITVDGGEGGTGAAPLEFSNSVGCPGTEALIFTHNALIGFSLRDKIRIFSTGKATSGFDIVRLLALGADGVFAARAFMLSLGCIQALRCNANTCPTGVATQNPALVSGLVVEDKRTRVAQFHLNTLKSVAELLGAMGLSHSRDLRPWHLMRRISSTEIRHFAELYHYLNPGDLLGDDLPPFYSRAMRAANADSFSHTE